MTWERKSGTLQRAERRLRSKLGLIHVSKPLEPDPDTPGAFRVNRDLGYTYPKDTYRGSQPRSSGRIFREQRGE